MARATKSISGRAGSTSCELDLLLPTSFTVINTSNPHQSPVRQEQFTPPIFQVNAMERILFPQNSYVEVISSSTSEYNCIWRVFKEVIKLKEVIRMDPNPIWLVFF